MARGFVGNQLMRGLKPGDKAEFVWDTEVSGFGVKITPRGSTSYVFKYRLGGRNADQRSIKIGQHGAWTPTAARDEAKRLRRLVDQGVDPRHDEKQRQHERVTLEVSSYAERFIEQYLADRWAGSFEMGARNLRKHVVPVWRGRYLKEIKRSDVAALMDRFRATPALRRNCFAVLRRMFRWAVNNGDLESSPMAYMEAPAASSSRERVLSDVELGLVWETAPKLGYPYADLVRLLVLTGQRRNEVAAIRWNELSRKDEMWVIPSLRAKNNVATHVPLSGSAIEILDRLARLASGLDDGEQPKEWPKSGFVFTTTGKTAVSGHSRAKSRLDRLIAKRLCEDAEKEGEEADSIDDWRFHDLRRTLATGLQRFGTSKEVTEAVLNHVSGSISGIAKVYQRHDYKKEKRAALDQWADHVATLSA